MRLTRYLIESNPSAEDILTDIKKRCKPYLSLLKGKEPLYRGLHDVSDAKATYVEEEEDELINRTDVGLGYGIKKVRKNRIPKGTPAKEFKILNKWLQGNQHARRDKSISVTSNRTTAEFFGNNSWVFPIGKFDYSWVKSPDMNHTNKNTGYFVSKWDLTDPEKQATISEFLKAYYSGTLDVRTKQADLKHFITTNKGFSEAYKNGYEIWIDCKEYYYILERNKDGFKYQWKMLAGYLK